MTAMTPYQQMIRAFQIFAEYPGEQGVAFHHDEAYAGPCLLYTSPSPRDGLLSRMPSSA